VSGDVSELEICRNLSPAHVYAAGVKSNSLGSAQPPQEIRSLLRVR
jgi:hypothetical protein